MVGILAGILLAFASFGGGTAEAAAACGQVFDARADFGATPNDANDDAAAIQRALDAASGSAPDCRGTAYLPAGTYLIGSPLTMRSYSILDGAGMGETVIQAKAGETGDGPSIMIKFRDVRNADVQDFHLDGNNSGLRQRGEHTGINLSGTSDSAVRRLRISDLGDNQSGRGPGGAHVRLTAYEPGDPAGAGSDVAGIDTRNNVIEGNVFDDAGFLASFGVRLKTNWELNRADNQFTRFVLGNRIQNNTFYGFHWNSVEIAGPATRSNTVFNNKFYNTHQTPLDADKGAKLNRFLSNYVSGVTQGAGNSFAAGMRDQGTPAQCSGGKNAPQRYAEGNEFRNNTLKNIKSSQRYAVGAGVALTWSRNATVSGNRIYSVTPGPGARVYPILEHDYSYAPTTGLRASGNMYNGKATSPIRRYSAVAAPC